MSHQFQGQSEERNQAPLLVEGVSSLNEHIGKHQFSEGPVDYEIFEDDSLKATDENQE